MKIKSYILGPLKASASDHLAIMRLSLCYHFIVIENMGKESLKTLVEETHSLSDYFHDISDAIWEKKINAISLGCRSNKGQIFIFVTVPRVKNKIKDGLERENNICNSWLSH